MLKNSKLFKIKKKAFGVSLIQYVIYLIWVSVYLIDRYVWNLWWRQDKWFDEEGWHTVRRKREAAHRVFRDMEVKKWNDSTLLQMLKIFLLSISDKCHSHFLLLCYRVSRDESLYRGYCPAGDVRPSAEVYCNCMEGEDPTCQEGLDFMACEEIEKRKGKSKKKKGREREKERERERIFLFLCCINFSWNIKKTCSHDSFFPL